MLRELRSMRGRSGIAVIAAIAAVAFFPLHASTRIVVVNASGYDSNLNNAPTGSSPAAVNDTKIRASQKIEYSNRLSFMMKAGLSTAYRQSTAPLRAQVVQALPRFTVGALWTPGILRRWDFRTSLDINYSHKFNPLYRNNPSDDQTNILNNSEDDGFHGLEHEQDAADHSSNETENATPDHHASDAAHSESAESDADDDYEDPEFVGAGSGQSYVALKSFTRSAVVNNYSSRLSLLMTPWHDGELRFAMAGGYNGVEAQTDLLPASSTAHSYEVTLGHEFGKRLELSIGYQIEFRNFLHRPAFTGSTDLFFVRTHIIPVELAWRPFHHARVTAAYSWIYRETPLHTTLNSILNVMYLDFTYNFNRHLGVSVWGGYGNTQITTDSSQINRLVSGLAVIYTL